MASENQKKYLGRTSQNTGDGHRRDRPHRLPRHRACGEMLEHLRKEKVAFTQRRANGQALFQLFLYDPNGIKVELNYAAAEAEGIAP